MIDELFEPRGNQDCGQVVLKRTIQFGSATFPYRLAAGGWSTFAAELTTLDPDRLVVVVDSGVPPEFVEPALRACRQVAITVRRTVEGGETAKRLTTLDEIASDAVEGGCTRRSIIVAIGGGAVGNLAGLLATLLFRGIRLVHVPTTLLAATDSVLSLKQAVNLRGGKNLLGSYLAPSLVWCDVAPLRALPLVQVRSGLFEVLKNVLVVDPRRIEWLMSLLDRDHPTLEAVEDIRGIVDVCIEAKGSLMADDPKERRQALALEYGHTVGHAIEKVSGGKVPHGQAVGIGMVVAASVSRELGYLDSRDAQLHLDLVRRINPAPVFPPVDVLDVVRAIRLDNKRGYVAAGDAGQVLMVLLERLGRPVVGPGELPLVPVDIDLVGECLKSFSRVTSGVH